MKVATNISSPQRLVLPIHGEAHCCRINRRVLSQQLFEVCYKRVVGLNAVEPIGSATEVGVKTFGRNRMCTYPFARHLLGQLWRERKTLIPKTGMMGTVVADDRQAFHPAAQKFVSRNVKAVTNLLFHFWVACITIEFGKCTKRSHFKCFPCWRHIRLIVSTKMFFNKIFIGTTQFCTQSVKVLFKPHWLIGQRLVHEPKRTEFHRKIQDDLSTHCYFQSLYNREHKDFQLSIKFIKRDDILEMNIWLEHMCLFISFHYMPILCQTEVTNISQQPFCFCLVIYQKPPLPQDFNLLHKGQGWFRITHDLSIKNGPACCTPLARACAGISRPQRYRELQN